MEYQVSIIRAGLLFFSIQLQGDKFGRIFLFKQKLFGRTHTNFRKPPHTRRHNSQKENHEDKANRMMEGALSNFAAS